MSRINYCYAHMVSGNTICIDLSVKQIDGIIQARKSSGSTNLYLRCRERFIAGHESDILPYERGEPIYDHQDILLNLNHVEHLTEIKNETN